MEENAELLILISAENNTFTLPAALALTESEYFSGLLLSGMKESQQLQVHLPELTSNGIKYICNFLKCKNKAKRPKITPQNFEDILVAANYLQITKILLACEHFLKEHLSPSNCYQVLTLGERLMIRAVVKLSETYMKKHIKEYSVMNTFKSLTAEEVRDFISVDDIGCGDEVDVFEASLNWLKHDVKIRSSLFCDILTEVRWGLMDAAQIKECLNKLELVAPVAEITVLIGTVKTIHDQPKNIHLCRNKWRKIRNSVHCFVGVGGFTGKSEHSTNRFQIVPIERLDTRALENSGYARHRVGDLPNVKFLSHKSEKIPGALCEHGACVCDNYLYVAGGQAVYASDGRFTQSKAWRYDPRLSQWTAVSLTNKQTYCVFDNTFL